MLWNSFGGTKGKKKREKSREVKKTKNQKKNHQEVQEEQRAQEEQEDQEMARKRPRKMEKKNWDLGGPERRRSTNTVKSLQKSRERIRRQRIVETWMRIRGEKNRREKQKKGETRMKRGNEEKKKTKKLETRRRDEEIEKNSGIGQVGEEALHQEVEVSGTKKKSTNVKYVDEVS